MESKMPSSRIWDAFITQKTVCTDTRKIRKGDVFCALKGANFDGNLFAAKALESGAAYAVVDSPAAVVAGDPRYLLVPDVLLALQDTARRYRLCFDIPFVAITGSNGKTTTKELVHAVLASERKAYATQGNLNNQIGVPLTLLAMPGDTEVAVIEMGANKQYDIEELVNIGLPTHGLITNIGQAHLEGMGGIEGVQRTKGEMFDFIREHNGHAFVNEGDPRVVETAEGIIHRTTYGGSASDYRILSQVQTDHAQRITIMARGNILEVDIQLLGRHNAENALLAVAVAQHFGISDTNIQKALANYVPRMNRSQLHLQENRKILLDAYNANPSSMRATIASIVERREEKVALVLGDMFELGADSAGLHAGIWSYAREQLPHALVVGIGPVFHATRQAEDVLAKSYPSLEEAIHEITYDLEGYEFILLKGSRGMALERLQGVLGVQV
jgi:UDP-N-acetylmuramoyl-tripeptide--D-alanyl-D-alanine ligase